MGNIIRTLAISFITLNKSYLYVLCLGDPKTLTPGLWTPLWTRSMNYLMDKSTDPFYGPLYGPPQKIAK